MQRTKQQLREHYELEKKLAHKLRNATKNEERTLYTSLYDELYRLIPLHPQLTRKESPEQQQQEIEGQMLILRRLLDKNKTFMEVDPGDWTLSLHVTHFVKEVYAVDVSKIITEASDLPKNYKLILSDGCSIDVPENSIDIIYSNQLIEHLHPDDAYDQLKNIYNALAPGGSYLCITPNRLNGPHDISYYFDTVATGFHLKEYTVKELSKLLKKTGFSKISMYIRGGGAFIRVPLFPAILCEAILNRLPNGLRQLLAKSMPIRALINVRLVGIKKIVPRRTQPALPSLNLKPTTHLHGFPPSRCLIENH